MENRKELSEKSKKLIAKHFNSDILNKSSGYYKTENIYPITSKPNELKINLEEFIPHFKEEKAIERHFNNLLSDKQRNNSFFLKYKKLLPNKNQELEIQRKRNKTIKDNCYDKKGNFSCKRRYILEFYGMDKLNNTFDYNDLDNNNINNINIIKDDRDISQDNDKDKEKQNDKENNNINKNRKVNNFKKYKNKVKELILKSRNLDIDDGNDNDNVNDYNENNFNIKPNYEEKFNTVNNINENNSFFYKLNDEKKHNKISRNQKQFDTNREIPQNQTINMINPQKIYNRIKTDIHFPDAYFINTQINITKKPKNFLHSKDISKLFYTKSNNPVKNIRIKKEEINKEDKDHYNLEFKLQKKDLKNSDISLLDNLNQKNIKEVFYRNGLHIYDINEDDMNILSIEKKMEAKLRKKRNDENFENNYKKAIKILEKKGIIVDKEQISNEKGYKNKNIIKKKRRVTPGKVLYDNRFHKDENTKINTGNNNNFKKGKNFFPQYDKNYKNIYKYKQKQLKK